MWMSLADCFCVSRGWRWRDVMVLPNADEWLLDCGPVVVCDVRAFFRSRLQKSCSGSLCTAELFVCSPTMTVWRKVWVQSRSRLSDSRIYAAFFWGGLGNGFNKLNIISCDSCLNAQKFSLCLCVELKLELEMLFYFFIIIISFFFFKKELRCQFSWLTLAGKANE